jgi:aldehyde:ferredoxin oxidoreductase
VYLYIHHDSVDLKDATNLWGKAPEETERPIKEETAGCVPVMRIGPGGENLVSFTGIVTALGSVAGRHGLGAVMGCEGLKVLAVRGTSEIKIAQDCVSSLRPAKRHTDASRKAREWGRRGGGHSGQNFQPGASPAK